MQSWLPCRSELLQLVIKLLIIFDASVKISSIQISFCSGGLPLSPFIPSSPAELSDPWAGPPLSHHVGLYLPFMYQASPLGWKLAQSEAGPYLVFFTQNLGSCLAQVGCSVNVSWMNVWKLNECPTLPCEMEPNMSH